MIASTTDDPPSTVSRRFGALVALAVALGALVRLAFVLTDDRAHVGGDGFAYRLEALRWADGSFYTSGFGDVGAPTAHHPPGWVTVLGTVTWFGGRSLLTHQLVGVTLGLGVIVLAGLVGLRYFDRRVGVAAAFLAAVYPGFWVLETQVLSEPLALFSVGLLLLALVALSDAPTVARAVLVGVAGGVLVLVRSEMALLLPFVVGWMLLRAHSLELRRRLALIAVAGTTAIVVIAPWLVYNQSRFNEPVILSTNLGATLLAGNCPPSTYSGGDLDGYFDTSCNRALFPEYRGLDRSEVDPIARQEAMTNITDNLERLPPTVVLRLGRTLAVYEPAQTVEWTAETIATDTWPVWLWVVSFGVLLPFAAAGAVYGRRSGVALLPLLAPVVLVVLVVSVFFGAPRYHTAADLGIVVLAAAGIVRLSSLRPGPGRRHPVEDPDADRSEATAP